VLLAAHLGTDNATISVGSFAAIAGGLFGCIVGGYLSRGSAARVA
jgi:hypothetical protein